LTVTQEKCTGEQIRAFEKGILTMRHKAILKMETWRAIFVGVGLLVGTGILRGGSASEFHSVESKRIPEILTMISERVRRNYDGIKTWRGEEEFTIDTIYEGVAAERKFKTFTEGLGKIPDVLRRRIQGRSQFGIDLEKDFLYRKVVRENPPRYTDLESGRDLSPKSAPSGKISILTPEYYISLGPYTTREGLITSRKAVKKAREKVSGKGLTCAKLSAPVSDPRERFVGTQPIWEILPQVVQHISEHGKWNVDGYALKLEERGADTLAAYRLQIPTRVSQPGYYRLTTWVFSSEKGFNIVLREETDSQGKLLHRNTWEYDLVNGIYVPSKATEQIFERKNGELSNEEEYIFRNCEVNKRIPEETFTYKNLSLKNGDKFVDKILGKEYTYQDGELIPASSGSSRGYPNVDGGHYADMQDLIILALRWLESEV